MNRLYYGDCLTIMQGMPPDSVDLIYLDPPFNSNRDYSAIYKDETGRPLPDQIAAFSDLWDLDAQRARAIRNLPALMREHGGDDAAAEYMRLWMAALRHSQPQMLAYLSYMAERLVLMRRVLKPTGSIYLHCDPTASHYLKVMMDAIFDHTAGTSSPGRQTFVNEIIWAYRTGGVSKHWFGRKHDVLLYYAARQGKHVFHVQKERSYSTSSPPGFKTIQVYKDETGRAYTMASMRDVWEINAIGRTSGERLGYATQKPLALLQRIITASSNPGDVVFDPFCGCATTIEAAHKLGRTWIGIDIAIHAIKRVASVRLRDRLGLIEGTDFAIEGVPHSMEGARDLWARDAYHFQKWAVEQVDGFVTTRKGHDGRIDGRLYFDMPGSDDLHSMVLEVKGGRKVGVSVVRDLRGVLERDTAQMAGLIVLDTIGDRKARNFAFEMAQAGDLEVRGVTYPRMQMLTVRDILDGKRFHTPSIARGKGMAAPELPLALK